MSDYFRLFPQIEYNDKLARKIVSRVGINNKNLNDLGDYYFYTLEDGDRPDTIANDYYGDSKLYWLVLLSNNIVDPYFQWPLSQQQFETMIETKYGSLSDAIGTILFYKKKPVNLYISYDTGDVIDQTEYDNASNQSRYFKYVDDDDVLISPDSFATRPDAADFEPVYAYQYEEEQNEALREIKLIRRIHVNSIVRQVEALLNDNQ